MSTSSTAMTTEEREAMNLTLRAMAIRDFLPVWFTPLLTRLRETDNNCYAAKIWKGFRALDTRPPDEVLAAFDKAAKTGELFSTRAKGKGNNSDVDNLARDERHHRILRDAIVLFRQQPRSQDALAHALGIEASELSRISSASKRDLPWRQPRR